MCVDYIENNLKITRCTGYKIFCRHGLHAEFYNYSTPGKPYRRCKWYTAVETGIFSRNCQYKSGFHIFTTLKGAREWRGSLQNKFRIEKVRFRDGHTIGFQTNHKVIVARETMILPKAVRQL